MLCALQSVILRIIIARPDAVGEEGDEMRRTTQRRSTQRRERPLLPHGLETAWWSRVVAAKVVFRSTSSMGFTSELWAQMAKRVKMFGNDPEGALGGLVDEFTRSAVRQRRGLCRYTGGGAGL